MRKDGTRRREGKEVIGMHCTLLGRPKPSDLRPTELFFSDFGFVMKRGLRCAFVDIMNCFRLEKSGNSFPESTKQWEEKDEAFFSISDLIMIRLLRRYTHNKSAVMQASFFIFHCRLLGAEYGSNFDCLSISDCLSKITWHRDVMTGLNYSHNHC